MQSSRYILINGRVFENSKYLAFIKEYGFIDTFLASGMTSPKKFCKERQGDLFKSYEVIKRLEG